MTNLSPEFCQKIREARRKAGISQIDLAQEVGCKQSALSMFECGDGTKLNDDVVTRIAGKFGIEIPKEREGGASLPAPVAVKSDVAHIAFCPNPLCPSNHAYSVGARRLMRPDRAAADPVGGCFCAVCGEVLERKCPNCSRPVHDGAVCSFCGEPYIALA